ncbi:hypothetical protein M422DRAFT_45361 [Sphaerobolus stellatus SS14]|nr:hypothetical protein M422DRAFT_45361 [Sphaerobolus stellatus SS14]
MSFAAIFGTFKISDSKINNLQPTSYVIYQVVLFSEAIGSIPSFIQLETTPEYRVIPNTTPVFVYGRISGPHLGPFYIDAIKIYPLLGPFTMPSYEPQISIVPYLCVIGHIPGGVTSMHESTHVFKMMSTSWAMTLFDPLITRSAVARRLPGDCSTFVVGPFTFEGGHERPYISPMANTQGRPYNPFRHGTIGPGSFRGPERFHAANFRFTPSVPRAEGAPVEAHTQSQFDIYGRVYGSPFHDSPSSGIIHAQFMLNQPRHATNQSSSDNNSVPAEAPPAYTNSEHNNPSHATVPQTDPVIISGQACTPPPLSQENQSTENIATDHHNSDLGNRAGGTRVPAGASSASPNLSGNSVNILIPPSLAPVHAVPDRSHSNSTQPFLAHSTHFHLHSASFPPIRPRSNFAPPIVGSGPTPPGLSLGSQVPSHGSPAPLVQAAVPATNATVELDRNDGIVDPDSDEPNLQSSQSDTQSSRDSDMSSSQESAIRYSLNHSSTPIGAHNIRDSQPSSTMSVASVASGSSTIHSNAHHIISKYKSVAPGKSANRKSTRLSKKNHSKGRTDSSCQGESNDVIMEDKSTPESEEQ